MEKHDILWANGPGFTFDTTLFCPSTDSFALAYFSRIRAGSTVCDLGSGTGLLGILLLARQEKLHIDCVELSAEACVLAERNFAENNWQEKVTIRCGDLRDTAVLPPPGSVDICLSNPPYFKEGSGANAEGKARHNARSEESCSLDALCAATERVLRFGGSFFLVHRPERLTDLFFALREHKMEPKRLRFVTSAPDSAPSLILLEARRGGKSGVIVEQPLIIGSPEWDYVYFR